MLAQLSPLLFLAVYVAANSADHDTCKPYFDRYCDPKAKPVTTPTLNTCSPLYGAADNNHDHLRRFIKEHIGNSFEYLLQWSNFNNYKKDRAGFAKLYRKLSDDTWEDSIKLVKYLGKRGIQLDFGKLKAESVHSKDKNLYGVAPAAPSETEITSLAKVLDLHKHLAITGNSLHEVYLKRDSHPEREEPQRHHDMEMAHFLEEEFASKHAQTVRDLAGHSNDLHRLIVEGEKKDCQGTDARGLYVHLFDEYLNKLY